MILDLVRGPHLAEDMATGGDACRSIEKVHTNRAVEGLQLSSQTHMATRYRAECDDGLGSVTRDTEESGQGEKIRARYIRASPQHTTNAHTHAERVRLAYRDITTVWCG